jgi:hypothetical protein
MHNVKLFNLTYTNYFPRYSNASKAYSVSYDYYSTTGTNMNQLFPAGDSNIFDRWNDACNEGRVPFIPFFLHLIYLQAWLAFIILLILFTAPLILLPFFPKALNWVKKSVATVLTMIIIFSVLNLIFMFLYFGKGDAWRYTYKCLQIGSRFIIILG